MKRRMTIVSVAALLAVVSCSSAKPGAPAGSSSVSAQTTGPASATHPSASTARAGHVVVVVMENHSYSDIIGSGQAPYINSLAGHGLTLTAMHALTHPSQPNYIALFSGSTHGITDDSCPNSISGANLASALQGAGRSFVGYSEGLPNAGDMTCTVGSYARKHAPWTNFTNLSADVNRPLSAFPSDYAALPTVSFVIPNLANDMHDGTVAQGDSWLQSHLAGYARWAERHDSLLVVTWDEDDNSEQNRIPTVIIGAGVSAKQVASSTTLYGLLRTIEDRYGLKRLGASATARPIPLH